VDERSPFRLQTDFIQQTPDSLNTHLCAIISLRETAFPMTTCHHKNSPDASLDGMEKVLCIGFATARKFDGTNMNTIFRPLARNTGTSGNALMANKYQNL